MGIFSRFFGKKAIVEPQDVLRETIDGNRFFDYPRIGKTRIILKNLGDLFLPTGQIIACDPLVGLYDTPAYTRSVAPGRYPVIACIAQTEDAGNRFAAVKLDFSKVRAVNWEMALIPGQDATSLSVDEIFGFGVDAGLGCFCDAATQALYNQWQEKYFEAHPTGDMYTDFLEPAFFQNSDSPNDPDAVGDWLNFQLPENPEHNIVMFSSGFGDGVYACYWGIAEYGEICSLVVDFGVV
jgi:hypothetical protein